MPKARKRSQPITNNGHRSSAIASTQTRNTIREFHRLLKRQAQLQNLPHRSAQDEDALAQVQHQIDALGGLATYQNMSAVGQSTDRGGGSERVLVDWLRGLNMHLGTHKLLEVGALKPDNYKRIQWLQVTPMDLNSRHPDILEQDFLTMDLDEHRERWDIISLSLVLNFVPDATDRGRMLELARKMLVHQGYLFLVLPLPCVLNSRYTNPEHLESLMTSVGFCKIHQRWKEGGKIAYWLFQKAEHRGSADRALYQRKATLRTGNRNNFHIRLP